MPKAGNAPTKAELTRLAKKLRPGERVTAGTGIYMTVDGSGQLRFQWRARLGGRNTRNGGGTCASFDEAKRERDKFLVRKGDNTEKRRERGRKMVIETLVVEYWWPHALTLVGNTQLDYRRPWQNDIYPFFKGMTLGDLLDFDDWSSWEKWLKKRHIKKDGTLAKSAIEKAFNILGRIFNFAVEEELLPYNPLERYQTKRRRRDQEARKAASKDQSTREVMRSEIPTPLEVELIRLWMPGAYPLERQVRRALITLLGWAGLRPGEALFLRWLHLRNAFGPLGLIKVRGALKDIAGVLEEGDTKTHTIRDAMTFPFVERELDELYHAAGSPPLGSLVFANRGGEFMRWCNFRDGAWYQALFRSGIADAPNATAVGAFYPYRLRHHAASLLLHASAPSGSRYSVPRIAESLGHTKGVLLDSYAKVIDDDVLGVGGRTIDEIARFHRRQVFGALPGEADFHLEELTTLEVAELTGLSVSQIGGRCQRGTLPSRREGSRYIIARHDLTLAGLAQPLHIVQELRRAA
jgi:integrase